MTASRRTIADFYLAVTDRLLVHEQRSLTVLFLFALVLRLAYIGLFVGFTSPPEFDGIGYSQLAEGLLTGRGYVNYWGEPTAFRPPVYPIFLAGVFAVTDYSFAAVRLIQAVLDSVTVLMVYGIARQLFGARVALLAGLGTALYPLLIYETGLLIAETLSYTLQFAATVCLVRMWDDDRARLPLLAGLLMALTVLARPTATLWVPLMLAWVLLARGMRHRVVKLVALAVGLGLVFAPWVVRNAIAFDAFIPISSLGGTGMWTANNPWSDGGSVEPTPDRWPSGDPPDRGWYGWSGVSETESSRRFSEAGRAWIVAHPDQFLALAPKKLLRTWSPTSFSVQFGRQVPPWLALAVGIPYVLFLISALCGVWLARGRWARSFPLFAIILSVNMLVIIYSGATRYGIPMTICFIPFAALTLDHLIYRGPAQLTAKPATD